MFRFTIRDLLWLMVVAALVCALIVTRFQFSAMQLEIERQSNRLFWAEANIKQLATGWQKDRPDRIKFEDSGWITIKDDDGTVSLGMPLRPTTR